jgi:hypothetical protein
MAEKVERLTYKIQFDAESGTSTIRGLDGTIKATMVSTQKLRQEYGNFATQIKATNAEINNLSGGKDGNGGLNGMSAASGGAAAAALELGRVVSDAPYGIRGMANNVSQLSSQILYMSQQTDAGTGKVIGFVGSLKGVFTALKGPLGVLLAIQVVVAALDFFAGGAKKAEDASNDLAKSYEEEANQLQSLIRVLNDSNLSLEKRAELEQIVIDKLPNVDKANTKTKEGLEELTKEVETYVEQQMLRIEIDRLVSDNADELAEHRERQRVLEAIKSAENQEEQIRIIKENTNILDRLAIEAMGADGKGLIARLISGEGRYGATDLVAGFEAFVNEEGADAVNILKQIDELTRRLARIKKENGNGGPKSPKEFKQNILDLSSTLEAFRNTEIQNMDITEEERLRLEYEASKKSVENKVAEFQQKEKLRLDDKIKQIQDSKATEDEKARLIEDANTKYNASIVQANEDLRSVMLQADIAYYAELSALRKKDTEAAKEESKDLIAALTENNFDYQEFNETQKINAATNDLNRIRDELEGSQRLTDLKVSGLEKELLAEEGNVVEQQKIRNKIAKLNQDQTLYEEELDRKSATAKIGIAMQIADTIAAIAGEGSGIAKGVAVAQTIWNTKQAFMAALGSAPYGPWNIAQATAVGVMGIKNVSDILATKAPNEKSADVSAKNAAMSGGGGGSAFNPNFNIVGASGSNQLAETVAGQIGEPTRAYVVYEANAIEASGI